MLAGRHNHKPASNTAARGPRAGTSPAVLGPAGQAGLTLEGSTGSRLPAGGGLWGWGPGTGRQGAGLLGGRTAEEGGQAQRWGGAGGEGRRCGALCRPAPQGQKPGRGRWWGGGRRPGPSSPEQSRDFPEAQGGQQARTTPKPADTITVD